MLDWEAFYNASQQAITAFHNLLQNYLDIAYLEWLAWLFWPLLVTFILPVSMLLFIYASAFFLHLYRLRHTLRSAVQRDHWDGARNVLAAIWDAQGRIWHGNSSKMLMVVSSLILFLDHVVVIKFAY